MHYYYYCCMLCTEAGPTTAARCLSPERFFHIFLVSSRPCHTDNNSSSSECGMHYYCCNVLEDRPTTAACGRSDARSVVMFLQRTEPLLSSFTTYLDVGAQQAIQKHTWISVL